MGAFVLVRKTAGSDPGKTLAAADASLREAGFAAPTIIAEPDLTLYAYPKLQFERPSLHRFANGDFVLSCGTLMFRGAVGEAACASYYEAFGDTTSPADEAMGHHVVVLKKAGKVHLIGDRFGGYQVFRDRSNEIVSSSLLVLANCLPRLTVLKQSVFEYVFNGVVSGNATMFEEIELLPRNARLAISGNEAALVRAQESPPADVASQDREALLAQAIDDLDAYFGLVAKAFGDSVSSALSGGYDSRLLLAMLRRHKVSPRLFVYGSPGDQDVRLAAEIAAGEGLTLAAINKDEVKPSLDEFPAVVEQNYLANDGYGWGGIFGNSAEIGERRRRTEGGAITLNGGGGEIYRNFFYLRDGRYTARQLLWSFYAQFDPRYCRSFDSQAYFGNMEAKLHEVLGGPQARLPRPTVEWLYHAFRCRSWDGKTNSINNRFGYVALPFLEHRVTQHASRIPIEMKNHGSFEAELICRIDKRLAAYPSNYGHNFVGAPPRSRVLHDFATYLRPPSLRRLTFRLKHRWRRPDMGNRYLQPAWVARILPEGLSLLDRLFRIEAVNDQHCAARIYSLEYALRRLGSKVGFDF